MVVELAYYCCRSLLALDRKVTAVGSEDLAVAVIDVAGVEKAVVAVGDCQKDCRG